MHPVIEQRRDELEQLCSLYRVSSLSLFGSAATAQYDAANSDLDFLVEFQSLPAGTYADTYFGLLETLEHMFERPVGFGWFVQPSEILTSNRLLTRPASCFMQLEARKFLYDIEQALTLIAAFTTNKSFTDYQEDAMLRAAVERLLAIIGEAVAQLTRLDENLVSRITEYRRIIAFRNILVHNYSVVSDELVWDIVDTKLPTLNREIQTLLSE